MRGKIEMPARRADGAWQVTFTLTDDPRDDYNQLNAHTDLEITAKPYRKRRSLDANSFCWGLCSRIADLTGITKEDVYRRNIREGNEYTQIPIQESAVTEFARIWGHNGIGWFIDVVDDSDIPGYKLVFAYHGSSIYDTKQMSALIDRILQDADSVGIQRPGEQELMRMIDDWDRRTRREESRIA